MKPTCLQYKRRSGTIFRMTDSGSSGAAAQPAPEPPVSPQELEGIQAYWRIPPDKKRDNFPPHRLTSRLGLRAFVKGLGNLIEVFPLRRPRHVYMPETTVEEDMREDWRDVGRDLCTVSSDHDSSPQTEGRP